jgi:hypothetical protein
MEQDFCDAVLSSGSLALSGNRFKRKSASPYFTTSHSNENKRLSQSGPVTLDKRVKFSILTFIKAFTPPTLSLTSHIRHHKEIRMIKARGRTNFNNLDMPEFFFNLDITL